MRLTIYRSIPLSSLVTPATLSVHPGDYYHNTMANVTSLDMSTVDQSRQIDQPDQFAVSLPVNGLNSTNNDSEVLAGPRTVVPQFAEATASTARFHASLYHF
jgi:hypothetical protein